MVFILSNRSAKIIGLIAGVMFLLLCISASIRFGITKTDWKMIMESYSNFNGSNEHIIIRNLRVPRALIAAAVGASLAIAGVLMQSLTKNPLAAPDILGINAGACFFVVFSASFFSISALSEYTWIAFFGGTVAAVAVYFVGSIGRDGLTPAKIVLAGAAITALFSSFTQAILVLSEKELDEILFWLTGSVEGRGLDMLMAVLPYMAIGWITAFLLGKSLNLLVMGEDVAKGLGQKTTLVKLLTGIVVILLAGSSVAVAGPISFVGIIIPHISRFFAGMDHRWRIPYSGLLGAILLLLADIGARFVLIPKEVPVGIMTAMIGTPFFVYIARRRFSRA
ncbi:FecCD family ABC transporter permease [Thermotalea metallivorans]|uniref:Putative siderophore transport system permease protein YfiZ n=1 Tax=Thermotalea metallivorans TaxID=520762 RepID=A0A140L6I6_9FIRM|nr:iron ABC transporter permease [Thermotalea metallivorans]KXG76161.1 putative siderophore transport system permease protein YfiZ [Thermotalea metallivorans]